MNAIENYSGFSFASTDGQELRAALVDGAPWFVAADVCKILDISNPTMALRALDADEKSQVVDPGTLNLTEGGKSVNNLVNIVSESGLYTLVLRNREATTPGTPAHRFRKWVTSEVLPALRKTGSYSVAPAPAETTPALPQTNPLPTPSPALEDALRKLQGLQALEEERYALIKLCEQLLQERLEASQAQIEALLAEQEKQRKVCMERISTFLTQIKEIEQVRKVHLAKEFGVESTGKLVKSETTSLSPELNSLIKIGALSA